MPKVLKTIHAYSWPAWPLALIAIALIVWGAIEPTQAGTAMVGAGAALAGAAATKLVDLDEDRRAGARQEVEASRHDLDETRRLCLTALISKGSGNHYLAATVANALAHHQQLATQDEALAHLQALADNDPDADRSEQWLTERVATINARLGDAPWAEPPAGSGASLLAGTVTEPGFLPPLRAAAWLSPKLRVSA